MALYDLTAIECPSSAAETLAVRSDALRDQTMNLAGRAQATSDSKHPEEGLALLKAYVAIDDRKIRQAILDVVVALSDRALRT